MAVFVITLIALMLAASTAVNAERVYSYRMCPNTDCEVYDMFIDPCPEAQYNRACAWPENSNTSVAFIYKPEFGAHFPRTQLYAETFLTDFPFLGINTNACLYTSCPVVKDTQQYWLFDLFVPPKKYVKTHYTIKFMLWDIFNNHQQCCFTFDVKIV
ncbi:unnamed protein product [Macrosiphum euphorbiae]|uniref:MD-2-related lipid-recognition domain-containing protein n=1 Tax=Macrosiphum euphorbiae TaxID=13131 RepID=A0AAV0XYU7_9HEMI|nr:unnamed protein product [Macrosiphum euphorbiae]